MPRSPTARPAPPRVPPRLSVSLSSSPARPDRSADVAASLDALRRVVRALRVSAGRTEEATGLSAAQLFVLEQVTSEPGLSLTELATRTLTDRTSVAAVVERLVTRGLVERGRSAEDRRRVEIRPTPEGIATLVRAPHPPTRRVLDGIARLDDRDLRRLAVGLSRLVQAMGVADEPPGMFFEEAPPARAARSASRRPQARGD